MERTPAHPEAAPELSVRAAPRLSPRYASVEDPDWTRSRCGSDSPSGTAALGSTLQESCEHSMHRILQTGAREVMCVRVSWIEVENNIYLMDWFLTLRQPVRSSCSRPLQFLATSSTDSSVTLALTAKDRDLNFEHFLAR